MPINIHIKCVSSMLTMIHVSSFYLQLASIIFDIDIFVS